MQHIYDKNGNKQNEALSSTMFWKSPLASLSCSVDLSTPNTYTWGEGISGGTSTPFADMKAVYNGSPFQCDVRILTYEDGSPIIEDGKLYFSMTTGRGQGSAGPIICEYDIGTCQLKLTGCIIAHYNGGGLQATGNNVMYNRNNGKWLLGSHTLTGHTLVIAESISDPRYGVTDIYYEDMDYQGPEPGDEDQFIFYSDELEQWVMVYVAIRNNDANYNLRMQTSDYPDHGYTFVKEVVEPSRLRATGVIVTSVGGTKYLLSGSSATGINKYLAYSFPDLEYIGELNLDYDTGSLKGTWPTLIPVTNGKSTKYFFFAFDRAQTLTTSVWTYGCLYMFCAAEENEGMEYPIKRDGITIQEPISDTYAITDLHFKRLWSFRKAMDYEVKLAEIKLNSAVIFDNSSNMYPVIIGDAGVTQNVTGLYLNKNGSAVILGGIHQPFAAYVLNNEGIQGSDIRAIVLLNQQNNIVCRISIDKDGNVYGYNGSAENLLGTMRENSKELVVCTGTTSVQMFER